jgi:hypothetical protein
MTPPTDTTALILDEDRIAALERQISAMGDQLTALLALVHSLPEIKARKTAQRDAEVRRQIAERESEREAERRRQRDERLAKLRASEELQTLELLPDPMPGCVAHDVGIVIRTPRGQSAIRLAYPGESKLTLPRRDIEAWRSTNLQALIERGLVVMRDPTPDEVEMFAVRTRSIAAA